MKKGLIGIFAFILLISTTGCSKKSETTLTNVEIDVEDDEGYIEPTKGGEIVLSMRSTQTLNPLLNKDSSVDEILRIIFEPLIKIDESYRPIPNIAENWGFSEDGKVLTINLKSGLKWHDGSDITSADVIFSLNTIVNSDEDSVYKNCIANISDYTRIDSDTVNITFYSADISNIYSMSFPLIKNGSDFSPVGNSAYGFSKYVPAKELFFEKSNNSFGKEAYIDTIKVLIISDRESDFYSFNQGIIDCIAADETELGKFASVQGYLKYDYNKGYYDFLGFNFSNIILEDISVRKSIAFTVPKESIIESIYLNNAVVADTPISPDSWFYDPTTIDYGYNPSHARTLLDGSGWALDDDGKYRSKVIGDSIVPLKLSILVNQENEERRQVAIRMATELRALGFEIEIVEKPFDEYINDLNDRNYDMFVGGWELSAIPDFSFMFATGGNQNFLAYSDENMDNLLSESKSAYEDDHIEGSLSSFQKYISDEIPYVSLVFRTTSVFTKQNVHGNIKPLKDNTYNNIHEWYID